MQSCFGLKWRISSPLVDWYSSCAAGASSTASASAIAVIIGGAWFDGWFGFNYLIVVRVGCTVHTKDINFRT